MKFGEKVRELRNRRGWSQEELAKRVGRSKRTIVNYESCNYYPNQREIYKQLAELFEVDQNYLLTEDEEFMADVAAQYGKRGQDQARDLLDKAAELFAGGALSDYDELAFGNEIQQLYLDSKQKAKRFTPKKYLK